TQAKIGRSMKNRANMPGPLLLWGRGRGFQHGSRAWQKRPLRGSWHGHKRGIHRGALLHALETLGDDTFPRLEAFGDDLEPVLLRAQLDVVADDLVVLVDDVKVLQVLIRP